jgi:hypothetical protein
MLFSPELAPFGAWIEQLIAESTGKKGKGILPVREAQADEKVMAGTDRIFVYCQSKADKEADSVVDKLLAANKPFVRIVLKDAYDLGGEFFRWEIATAIAGHILNINPFDQPNVESAKVQARQMVDRFKKEGQLPVADRTVETDGFKLSGSAVTGFSMDEIKTYFKSLKDKANADIDIGYIAIQAYMMPSADHDKQLMNFRKWLQSGTKKVVTVGYGPRFLHSTGQLHKGDNGKGFFIQILSKPSADCPIPDKAGMAPSSITFGILIRAQAFGDRQALIDAHRALVTIDLGQPVSGGLKKFRKMVS